MTTIDILKTLGCPLEDRPTSSKESSSRPGSAMIPPTPTPSLSAPAPGGSAIDASRVRHSSNHQSQPSVNELEDSWRFGHFNAVFAEQNAAGSPVQDMPLHSTHQSRADHHAIYPSSHIPGKRPNTAPQRTLTDLMPPPRTLPFPTSSRSPTLAARPAEVSYHPSQILAEEARQTDPGPPLKSYRPLGSEPTSSNTFPQHRSSHGRPFDSSQTLGRSGPLQELGGLSIDLRSNPTSETRSFPHGPSRQSNSSATSETLGHPAPLRELIDPASGFQNCYNQQIADLNEWHQTSYENNQSSLDDLIVRYIHNDQFRDLCNEMHNSYRRIGLPPSEH